MVSPYIEIIRPHQWYKNLLITIGIIFAGEIQNLNLYPKLILGFFALSFISGVNYIINDLTDLEKDKMHPDKKNRPLPSGKIKKSNAVLYAIFLFIISIVIAFKINIIFGFIVLAIFCTSQIYTFWAKNIVFLDIILISTNFIWRAVSGIFVLELKFSEWLVLCTFFLALFIALCKRKGDLISLGVNAYQHKEVLNKYTIELLNLSIAMASSSLLLSYSLYSFSATKNGSMMITIPVATFLVLRYLYLTSCDDFVVGKNPEQIFKDRQFMVGIFIWLMIVTLILY